MPGLVLCFVRVTDTRIRKDTRHEDYRCRGIHRRSGQKLCHAENHDRSQGINGLGDATLNNRETLPATYLKDYLIPSLIGMDPRRSKDIWRFFYRGAYFRRGPIAMAAFGASDMAPYDIKGSLQTCHAISFLAERAAKGQWFTHMQRAQTSKI